MVGFNLLFLTIMISNEKSRLNFLKLGATLQDATLEFKFLLNLFFVGAFFIIYNILKNLFNLRILDNTSLQKYHKLIVIVCLTIFCFLPASIFIGYKYNLIDSFFRAFGIGHIKPNFIDLRGTLAAINKVKEVGEGYQIDCPNEPCIGWRWTYGSSILKLNRFSIFSESNTYLFASIFMVIFLCVIYLISKNIKTSVILLTLIPTGTMMLIIERMNIDILLLPIIYFLARLAYTNTFMLTIAPILILLAASVKYYPLILLFPLVFFINSNLLRIYYFLCFLLGVIYIIPELKLAGAENFSYGYSATYGLRNLVGIINGSPEPKLILSFITLLGLIFFSYVSYISFNNFKIGEAQNNQSTINFSMYCYGFAILLSSWVLNSNYPYRLICVVAMIPYLIDKYGENTDLVLTSTSSMIIYFVTIPVTLSPIRNLMLTFFIALNIGILVKIYFLNGKLANSKKSNLNSNRNSRNLLLGKNF
jgi:hypothetical protein